MNMDQAAYFFVGSILIMLGLIVVATGTVIINNIFSKYWKPIRIFWPINTVEELSNERTQQPRGPQKD